jgi:tetratricopeptide (TPR) repeat protein
MTTALGHNDNDRVIELAPDTIAMFEELGDPRAAARSRLTLGRALRRRGRHTEARDVLTQALADLRDPPDEDTLRALDGLAAVENFAATPEAEAANRESFRLAEGLGAGPGLMAPALLSYGIYLVTNDRLFESGMYLEKAAELAEQAGDTQLLGISLANLSNMQLMRDPAAAEATCRRCLAVVSRLGDPHIVANATINLVMALLDLGKWDEVASVLAGAADADDQPEVLVARAIDAGSRGDAERARAAVARLDRLRTTEDPQFLAAVATADLFLALAEGRTADVLEHSREATAHRESLGIGSDPMRHAWPAGTRAAFELGDLDAVDEFVAMLDGELPGSLPPLLSAELELVRARRTFTQGGVSAGEQLQAAISTMRSSSPPHLLAHGLLDHAAYLLEQGDDAAAAVAVAEAREIGERLGCRPVLDRADHLSPVPGAVPSPR